MIIIYRTIVRICIVEKYVSWKGSILQHRHDIPLFFYFGKLGNFCPTFLSDFLGFRTTTMGIGG